MILFLLLEMCISLQGELKILFAQHEPGKKKVISVISTSYWIIPITKSNAILMPHFSYSVINTDIITFLLLLILVNLILVIIIFTSPPLPLSPTPLLKKMYKSFWEMVLGGKKIINFLFYPLKKGDLIFYFLVIS